MDKKYMYYSEIQGESGISIFFELLKMAEYRRAELTSQNHRCVLHESRNMWTFGQTRHVLYLFKGLIKKNKIYTAPFWPI